MTFGERDIEQILQKCNKNAQERKRIKLKREDMNEKEKQINEYLTEVFREYMKGGWPVDINGVRYKTTGRGPIQAIMPDSRLYNAFADFMEGKGPQPDLYGSLSAVVNKNGDLWEFRIKWKQRAIDYVKVENEDGTVGIDIDLLFL